MVWQVELASFPRLVLARHWPEVDRSVMDVRKASPRSLGAVDLICGGFPCQDISIAGKGRGLAGTRSGLWREFARVVREFLPRFVVVENVPALVGRGLDRVLGDLAEIGFDCVWGCVRASDAGAPHKRERLFVVAYRNGDGSRAVGERGLFDGERSALGHDANGRGAALSHANGATVRLGRERLAGRSAGSVQALEGREPGHDRESGGGRAESRLGGMPDGISSGMDRDTVRPARALLSRWPAAPGLPQHGWEPARTVRALPDRGARLEALGNAVVPHVARLVGRRVVELLASETCAPWG